jgi:formylglycine-generating enzyme
MEPKDSRDAMSETVWIPGGTFSMGSDKHYPEERPAHRVSVDGFWMDRSPVTNRRFTRFVEATGYVTRAETAPNPADYPNARPELLVAGSMVFIQPRGPVDTTDISNWWQYVRGADWRHPYGPESALDGLDDHPVVHVTLADAEAFAAWEGTTLPTEAEWEFAARGGLEAKPYAWGDQFRPADRHMANTWQGEFPHDHRSTDGYERTSPVGAFPANGYGLHDLIGNVWEWTTDWYRPRHDHDVAKACCVPRNPLGPRVDESPDPNDPLRVPRKVLKGGSHLCAPNFCRRYRPAARYPQSIDTSTSHVGFRCIRRS